MLSVLGGGALGMFLFASQTGKQQVHLLHDIFLAGAIPTNDDNLNYRQRILKDAQSHQRDDEYESLSLTNEGQDRERMDQVRVLRRQSIMNGLEKGHGLSDSHGGQWYRDEDVDPERFQAVRAIRRRSLMNSFKKGNKESGQDE